MIEVIVWAWVNHPVKSIMGVIGLLLAIKWFVIDPLLKGAR